MELLELSIKLDLSVSEAELVPLAERAFEIAYQAQDQYLGFTDVEIHVWVEQGSTNYRTKILAGLTALYFGIANFDGFVSGLERINDLGQKTINYITENTVKNSKSQIIRISGSIGLSEKLTKILKDIQAGKLTPEQGTNKVLKLLQIEVGSPQEKKRVFEDFQAAIGDVTIQGEQLEMFPEAIYVIEDNPKKPRKSLPFKNEEKPSLQGVEIWYDRKSGRREIRRYTK